ncbi:MAG: TetR/AcrR family transcriptional regulator [Pararhodobacter sp.]
MAQVKKAEVRDAILDAAFQLFSEKDYASTTIAQIARAAGVSQGNIYVYFASKLDILWAVMSPWLYRQVELLDLELARIPDPHTRVERLLLAIWGEIPDADNNLAVNLVQGLALSKPGDSYSRDLLRFLELRLTRMLRDCLPPERWHLLQEDDALAHLVFMAFDGFVLGARVKGRSDRLAQTARLTASMILGVPGPVPPAGVQRQEAVVNKDV